MTYPEPTYGFPANPPAAPPERRRAAGDGVRDDLRFAAKVAGILVGLGAVLGLVWAFWSPPGPRALVLARGVLEPDETESFIAGDGRYLVITAVVGLIAALLAWRRVRNRGPLVLLALGVGGLIGSLLTELVGHLAGGGTFNGAPNTIINALPLSLHMQGLLFVEAAVATLVYGLFVAFAARDDLGRRDPVRDSFATASVRAGDQPQDGWGYGDAPGALQQSNLPPQ
jgi:hypothetical protein